MGDFVRGQDAVSLSTQRAAKTINTSGFRPSERLGISGIANTNALSQNAGMTMPNILALDVEGTLISNAISQIPRPNLFGFLEDCHSIFPRIVIYTALEEARFRSIARTLVGHMYAPAWFAGLEYVDWNRRSFKDLRNIPRSHPNQVLLIDDLAQYIYPEQESQWIPIEQFAAPYPETDDQLLKITTILRARIFNQ